ncbi:UDP-N-acetylmuramate dehydrogenase [Faecalibacterium sp. An192]|uniref:UDP-N-acetylmuramate dehydrogenase n=1 Tax=Faecalibacterium sp. An192 TaxID=1965581 RepID=UPI000B39FFF1|nr:UDP-N-acetylmuramate dehydrogenase [Faecalibacterium sp. An192]OUP27029.1 UDP-N-acetylenolpyruvoylglucosamine reductase [Faecalibacterium sp. An192]
MDALRAGLDAAGVPYQEQEPLSAHTTFKIGGPAAFFIRPTREEELCKAVTLCKSLSVPCYILGNGSNILFGDKGWNGAVICLAGMKGEIQQEGDTLWAPAGMPLSMLCMAALQAGLTGLEFAYGIPGTVGGAVYMNAGAYGGEMKDVLVLVRHLTAEGEIVETPAAGLDLSYRHSIFEDNGDCILSAQVRLTPGDPQKISDQMNELMGRRRDKQPLDKPSAGSTFKRPVGAFAGALIEQCGLRGHRHGGAAISEKHCGFVVNLGGATCADVLALCQEVQTIVREQTGFTLEKEIRVVEC